MHVECVFVFVHVEGSFVLVYVCMCVLIWVAIEVLYKVQRLIKCFSTNDEQTSLAIFIH